MAYINCCSSKSPSSSTGTENIFIHFSSLLELLEMCPYFLLYLLGSPFLYSFVTHFVNVFQPFRCTYKPERVQKSSCLECQWWSFDESTHWCCCLLLSNLQNIYLLSLNFGLVSPKIKLPNSRCGNGGRNWVTVNLSLEVVGFYHFKKQWWQL